MIDIFWLDQSEADIPQGDDWLSADEVTRQNAMHIPKRRADWRLGRWTAKRAIATYLQTPDQHQSIAEIEIRPAPSGAPQVFVAGKSAPASISLSHHDGHACCAIGASDVDLGCDLEVIEPRSAIFITDFFAAEEQALIANTPATDRPCIAALLWSAKESALKAMRIGLRLDTRSVVVSPDSHGESPDLSCQLSNSRANWRSLRVHLIGKTFNGWWQSRDNFVRTLVAAPPPGIPVSILMT